MPSLTTPWLPTPWISTPKLVSRYPIFILSGAHLTQLSLDPLVTFKAVQDLHIPFAAASAVDCNAHITELFNRDNGRFPFISRYNSSLMLHLATIPMKLTSDVDCDISEHPYSMLTDITKANIANNDLQGLRVFRNTSRSWPSAHTFVIADSFDVKDHRYQ